MKLLESLRPARPAELPPVDEEAERRLRARWMQPDEDGGTLRDGALRTLERLREGQRPARPLDLRGLRLVDVDLAGLDLTGADLSGADLSRANLSRTRLLNAKLAGCTLFEARLEKAELSGADLTGANLQGARAGGVGLGMAKLVGATLLGADLRNALVSGADLTAADLRQTCLEAARLREADLSGADLSRANLRGAELAAASVRRARFDQADLRGSSLEGLRGFRQASWIGVHILDIDFSGAYLCRRFIQDQNYLEEFKRQGRWARVLHALWWLSSDCGRSLARWSAWTAAIVVSFAGVYRFVDVDFGPYPTSLSSLYYSVVTLTTLGYGDVLPRSPAAQVVAMVEVVLGYVMLGGLLSIFSNKMARRAD